MHLYGLFLPLRKNPFQLFPVRIPLRAKVLMAQLRKLHHGPANDIYIAHPLQHLLDILLRFGLYARASLELDEQHRSIVQYLQVRPAVCHSQTLQYLALELAPLPLVRTVVPRQMAIPIFQYSHAALLDLTLFVMHPHKPPIPPIQV